MMDKPTNSRSPPRPERCRLELASEVLGRSVMSAIRTCQQLQVQLHSSNCINLNHAFEIKYYRD